MEDNVPIKGVSKVVCDILSEKVNGGEQIKYPQARDCDAYLVMVIWTNHLRKHGYTPEDMGAWQLLGMIGKNELPNTDSISRCRQKVQEHNTELRGKKWEKRQHNAKNNVKEEIKNWNAPKQMGLR